MRTISKRSLKRLRAAKKRFRKIESVLDQKASFLGTLSGKKRLRRLKKYYKGTDSYKKKWKWKIFMNSITSLKLPLWLSFFRWIIVDFLRGKMKRKFGIFQFVALPGEGKTMSMVAHMERYRKEFTEKKQPFVIASNFSYKYNNSNFAHKF